MGEARRALTPEEERRVQSLTFEFRVLEGMAGELRARIEAIDAVLRNLFLAKTTLENLEKLEVGDEILVPIGGDSFLKAKIMDKDRVIIGIGAGVTVEKTLKEAVSLVDGRTVELGRARADMEKQLAQVMERMEYIRGELQKFLGSTQ
ncbi:MAG: prefoldin subunit alpha [Candidatus Hecatellales archaeon]|nr:MAG: prefoldin subunit alpha [Candidatus Hecatellales archaeon]RLI33327.1 MAG: prefoldin subunit alpha [Candidatus Bathyarchaeota archaeon]